ncbi:MAG: PEP-utilizing enzyme [Candidatus Bathyarchaeota archaeon]|nr:PEP-utilizing enzyme [Candidatus Bathyarchaeota archaeon]
MNRKSRHFVRLVTDFRNDRLIGEKAKGIKYLMKNGCAVPLTYVCSSDAYEEYLRGNPCLEELLKAELTSRIDLDKSYAVRSSATLEDNPSHSFAGQFKTFLNVRGMVQILESIMKVWESARSNRIALYSKKASINLERLKMAVIIQQMVEAEASGVAFTKNPMNGRDEVTIESVNGLGDSLLQDRVDPNRGVYKWGEWVVKPDVSGMPLSLLKKVVEKAKVLEKKRRTPLNLEWAYDGHALYWLQMCEITTLSGLDFHSNKLAKEFLPGIIKPLVWSVNIPVVCGAWTRLLSELVGDLNIDPQDLAKPYYYRAYFNMGVIGDVFDAFGMPREGLEVLMGYGANAPEKPSLKPGPKSLKHLPNLVLFTVDKIFFGRKMRKFINGNDGAVKKICHGSLETMNEFGTIKAIDKLYRYNEKAAYFVIVSQLLNGFFNKVLTDQLKKKGGKLEDLHLGYADYRDMDPNWGIRKLHQEYMALPKDARQKLRAFLKGEEDVGRSEDLNRLMRNFENFIRKFGHLSDRGNDFSSIPWSEQPRLVLNMVIDYKLRSRSKKETKREKPIRKSSFLQNWAYHKARESLEYKERISFNYTKSYGLFRRYFLHLAKLFQMKGYLLDLNDIFYFTFDEIQEIVENGRVSSELSRILEERKREIAETKDIELPELIFGDKAPVPIRKDRETRVLRGTPASGGYYTGNTCVVKGVHDFAKVTQGAVIIIPFSDISWIPVFSKAGAVISESGGILSHSAIIAREYGIPSIVGAKGACDLGDDRRVYVDGFSGRITIC